MERAFGVLKNWFFALKTGICLKDPKEASKIIVSVSILHNLAIRFGDHGEELTNDDDDDSDGGQDDETNLPMQPSGETGTAAENRERRRNQLLQFFQQF